MPKPQQWITCLGGCALSLLTLLPGVASAQVSVSPLVIETQTQRGQAQGVITISNVSDEPYRARVYAAPFTYNLDGFEVLESSPNDLTPYLIFSPTELVVEPGQTRRIRLAARLLPSMASGEYRAVIFTESLAPATTEPAPLPSNTRRISIVPRVGVTMYVRQGETDSLLVAQNAGFEPDSGQLALLVINQGNATERPQVQWTLSQSSNTVETGIVPETTVIAEGARRIPIEDPTPESPLAPGSYTLSGQIVWPEGALPFSFDVTIPSTR